MNKEHVAKKKFEKSPIQKKKVLINNSEGGANERLKSKVTT